MKIALCLYGLFNNSRQPDSGINGARYISDKILKPWNPDIFIHSWEKRNEDMYRKLFNPKEMVFEEPIDFKSFMKKKQISNEYFDFCDGFDRKSSAFSNCKIESTLSFLYSRTASLTIMKAQSEKYDVVICCRFDLGQIDSKSNRKYKVSLIDFNPTLDMSFIYSAMWDQLNAGYADQWFYSNEDNMMLLADMFKKSWSDYFRPGSGYEQAVTKGWPDSQWMDHDNSADSRQFSNEMLSKDKSKELMKYPKWQVINNHLLHKWHFIKSGLYDNSRFLVGS